MNLMPQIGFFEIVLVAVIALIVVGPRDLPRLMRMAGRLVAQARRMAGEFSAAFNQMARETEMEEMRREIESLKRDNVFADAKRSIEDATKPIETAMRDEAAEIENAAMKPVGERAE
ncbi:MAG: Sec-independent protein translocase protein TatB [Parvularculaceae bacterium]|nr:twin-arginine translocase subunit TatB [Parvularculaceae bacterium]